MFYNIKIKLNVVYIVEIKSKENLDECIALKSGVYVITGAPCTGKTTVINELHKQGYFTVEEPSRPILEKYPELRADIASNEAIDRLQKMILKVQIEVERNIPRDKPVFMDGGIPSDMAFCRIRGLEPFKELLEAGSKTKYDGVFIMDRLPIYQNDGVRQQTEKESIELQELLYRAYTSLGYKPIKVPVMAPEERVELIKKMCSK